MNSPNDLSLIKKVVDKYFDFMDELGGNAHLTISIPPIMLDPTRKGNEEWSYWIPIQSTVTDTELTELEAFFGHKLPHAYKYFLKQRHFVELQLGSYAIGFFSNLPGNLVLKLREIIYNRYNELPGRNYLPIAGFMDFGVLCFDANSKDTNNDYPVVMFNHEDGYGQQDFYTNNFLEMFYEFDTHLDDWIKNNHETRKKT